jgi:muramoyltetrapeptide carboxypeptidase LdcA involved in peptidoglycan recycling
MPHDLIRPPKARRGERVAVLSPSFAAAGAFPAVHEQAMRRLTEITGLIPVEYPTTRKVDATPRARADDLNAAFADPAIRGVLTVIGGEDQITVISHLNAELARRDPKPFLGTSDNTNLHHWL